jgi:hypothetical protein
MIAILSQYAKNLKKYDWQCTISKIITSKVIQLKTPYDKVTSFRNTDLSAYTNGSTECYYTYISS